MGGGGGLSLEEEQQRTELGQAARTRELDAWKKFDVYEPRKNGNVSKQIAKTRWVSAGKTADERKSVKAHLAPRSYRNPDPQEGLVDTSGYVRLRSYRVQALSLCAIKKWIL